MPNYSNESLKKHPWLWKYDSRRSAKCSLIGHRHRWFHYKFKPFHGFFGVCKKCEHTALYRLIVDKQGLIGKVYKQFGQVIEITKEEAEQFMGEMECKSVDIRDGREIGGMDVSQGDSKPSQNSPLPHVQDQ